MAKRTKIGASDDDFFLGLVRALIRGVYSHCGPATSVETTTSSAVFVVGGRSQYEIHVNEPGVVRVCRRIVKKLDWAFEYRATVSKRGGLVHLALRTFGEREEHRSFDAASADAVEDAARFVLDRALAPAP